MTLKTDIALLDSGEAEFYSDIESLVSARKPAFEFMPHHRYQGFRVVAYPLKRHGCPVASSLRRVGVSIKKIALFHNKHSIRHNYPL
jgi:hypothetical protein